MQKRKYYLCVIILLKLLVKRGYVCYCVQYVYGYLRIHSMVYLYRISILVTQCV
jgi:hypothetical protein